MIKYNIFYSTPEEYTLSKHKEVNITWSSKTDDFFPYADCENCYWTGFFSSRTNFKYLERISSSFLQLLKQIVIRKPYNQSYIDVIVTLSEAIGIANHHDAITGIMYSIIYYLLISLSHLYNSILS